MGHVPDVPGAVAHALAALVAATLAVVLARRGGTRLPERLFVLLLGLWAAVDAATALAWLEAGTDNYVDRVGLYLGNAWLVIFLAFGALWPHPIRHARLACFALAAFTAGSFLAYTVDPSVYDMGRPLNVVWGVVMLLLVAPAVRWMRLARGREEGASLYLMAVVAGAFISAYVTVAVLYLALDPAGTIEEWGLLNTLLFSGLGAVALVAFVAALVGALRGPGDRRLERRVAAGVAAFFAFTAVASVLDVTGRAEALYYFTVLGNVLSLALLAYALLRLRVFDLDLKVKWGIRRGTVVAVFAAAFFVVAELAQTFLSEAYGWAAGGLAAGALLLAVRPLERVADRVADAAMPGVLDTSEWRAARRLETYRFSVRAALADGVLTAEEDAHLHTLAEELGLGAVQAAELRREVARELGLERIHVAL